MSLYEAFSLLIALISAIGVVWAAYTAWKAYENKRK